MSEFYLLPFRGKYFSYSCDFQLYNVPDRTARHMKEFFMEEEIIDMDSPLPISDTNIIENGCLELSRHPYRNIR